MSSEIIIDAGIVDTRVAILEEGELAEFYIERPYPQRLTGNIYRGIVNAVLRGMQAAFVDIGHEKNAFLFAGDITSSPGIEGDDEYEFFPRKARKNITQLLTKGQEITVQVTKEPQGTKGPRVATSLTLPGRYLVLMPDEDYSGVSRRIENESERLRLKKIAEKIRPDGMGIIVRTFSEGCTMEELQDDLDRLVRLHVNIKKREKAGRVPRCIHKDHDLLQRTVRDMLTADTKKLVINDIRQYEALLEMPEIDSPNIKCKIEYYSKDYDIFDFYNVAQPLSRALGRKVWLKSGGYIVMEQTEALTVIDVNTGKFTKGKNLEETAHKTNNEAAVEIAKQLRLRDIGGIIVIDFIDMYETSHKQSVVDTLRSALRKDKTKSSVVGITGLGLVEMTRKKTRQGLYIDMTNQCECCEGAGRCISPETAARGVEKEIQGYIEKSKDNGNPEYMLTATMDPKVAEVFTGKKAGGGTSPFIDLTSRFYELFGVEVKVQSSDTMLLGEVSISKYRNL